MSRDLNQPMPALAQHFDELIQRGVLVEVEQTNP